MTDRFPHQFPVGRETRNCQEVVIDCNPLATAIYMGTTTPMTMTHHKIVHVEFVVCCQWQLSEGKIYTL
jgi:hypothetical protein